MENLREESVGVHEPPEERVLPQWMLKKTTSQMVNVKREPDAEKRELQYPMEEEEASDSQTVFENDGQSDSHPTEAVAVSAEEVNENTNPTTSAASSINRAQCKYGERCFRANPAHKSEYSHPGDADYLPSPSSSGIKPDCQYGTACYRKNPQHIRDFNHSNPPAAQSPPAAASSERKKRPAKRRRTSDEEEDESEANEYDLNDSFLDESESEKENEEDSDDDYIPDPNEVDQELLKEEQWKPKDDDPPEVLELLNEAANYLRNKKLHV